MQYRFAVTFGTLSKYEHMKKVEYRDLLWPGMTFDYIDIFSCSFDFQHTFLFVWFSTYFPFCLIVFLYFRLRENIYIYVLSVSTLFLLVNYYAPLDSCSYCSTHVLYLFLLQFCQILCVFLFQHLISEHHRYCHTDYRTQYILAI